MANEQNEHAANLQAAHFPGDEGCKPNRIRTHSYQASASAFGGNLDRPIRSHLPVLAPSSLPSAGGYHSSRNENFSFHEMISISEAYSHVGGSSHPETGNWTTVATSVIKGLSVGHFLYADRIVAQITLEHPVSGHHPRVSFLGTLFEGLRIGTVKVNPMLRMKLFELKPHQVTDGFPSTPYVHDANWVAEEEKKSKTFTDFWHGQKGPDRKPLRRMFYQPEDTENSADDVKTRGTVRTSLVDKIGPIEGELAGVTCGHGIYVPGFGRVFLGELIVGNGSFDLTMLRLDLGSSLGGQASGPQTSAGGSGGKGGPIGGNIGTGK